MCEVGTSECVAIAIIVAVREVIAAVADPYLDFPVLPGCSCARFLCMQSAVKTGPTRSLLSVVEPDGDATTTQLTLMPTALGCCRRGIETRDQG